MTRRGRASAITRHRTPNGSVDRRPGRVAGREADHDRTWKIAEELRHHGARRRIARWLVAFRQLADDDRRRPREQAALPQLRHHPVEAVRALADFVEEQHEAMAEGRTRTACRASRAAASPCRPEAARAASPRRTVSSPAGASSPIGSRPAQGRHRASRGRIPSLRRGPAGLPASVRGTRRGRSPVVRNVSSDGQVAVADERLARDGAPRRGRAAAAAARCRSRRARR